MVKGEGWPPPSGMLKKRRNAVMDPIPCLRTRGEGRGGEGGKTTKGGPGRRPRVTELAHQGGGGRGRNGRGRENIQMTRETKPGHQRVVLKETSTHSGRGHAGQDNATGPLRKYNVDREKQDRKKRSLHCPSQPSSRRSTEKVCNVKSQNPNSRHRQTAEEGKSERGAARRNERGRGGAFPLRRRLLRRES